MLWFLFARGRKPQCEVKSPRSLCFDKWQKLNSKSFVVLPNITWKFPSLFFLWFKDLFITWVNLPNKWEEHCKKEFVLMWRLWFTNIFFFSYNDKACGFDDKKCRIYKLTEQGHLCEFSGGSTWNCGDSLTPRIFFWCGKLWGTIWPR